MRRLWFVAALCAACSSSGTRDTERLYVNEEQRYSVAQPYGWDVEQVRGFAQLSPAKDTGKRKHTIVIRSAEKPPKIREGIAATHEALIATTKRVLRSLPRATLGNEVRVEGTELPATRISLSFVPRGLTRIYRREHAVLVGTKRIYHVIYTSPANEPMDEASFAQVVSTLSEEG